MHMTPPPQASVLIVGHGSSRNPRAVVSAEQHADRLRATGRFARVASAHLKGGRVPAEALRALPDGDLFVVPLFMSDGYFTQTAIPANLGLTGRITQAKGRRLFYCDPVGIDPRIADIVADDILSIARREAIDPAGLDLLLIGHGSPSNSASRAVTLAHARRLEALGRFGAIDCAFLDEEPTVETWFDRLKPIGAPLAVAGLFAADGMHASTDVPSVLADWQKEAQAAGAGARRVWYAGAVGSRPAVTDLILNAIDAAAALAE